MRGLSIAVAVAALAAFAGQADASAGYRLLKLEGTVVKWGGPALGTGAVVTYAFVDAPTRIRGARNCGGMEPANAMLRRQRIDPEAYRAEVAAAFALWSEAADIAFRHVEDTTDADILIGVQTEPRGRAFANVSFKNGADGDAGVIDKALICLNPRHGWKVGFDGDMDVYDLRYTVAHEIGHAIGLDHPESDGQLMAFRYDERFRGPQAGDIRGAVALYGSRLLVDAGDAAPARAADTRPPRAPADEASPEPALSLGQPASRARPPLARLPD